MSSWNFIPLFDNNKEEYSENENEIMECQTTIRENETKEWK